MNEIKKLELIKTFLTEYNATLIRSVQDSNISFIRKIRDSQYPTHLEKHYGGEGTLITKGHYLNYNWDYHCEFNLLEGFIPNTNGTYKLRLSLFDGKESIFLQKIEFSNIGPKITLEDVIRESN